MEKYDVIILGGGPAGLSAALAAKKAGASTLIIEREKRPGGILKQCIHDGFGLITFKEKLSGPEYAERFIDIVRHENIPIWTSTFVTSVEKVNEGFELMLVNSEKRALKVYAKALILANGCRERSAKQVFIHGTRPAGVYTAGTAQHFVNIMGYLPCKRCVILGSGDIGLIMARRLTLEGAEVLGVYEAKPEPSGLRRNIVQCLEDYGIPLYLSHTVTRVFGDDRVESCEISEVDKNLVPIPGTERIVECDSIILSVGLIPENEIAEKLNIKIDNRTKGPYVDQKLMTEIPGIFSCGNALHVNDLVDYVSESGKTAGESAAEYCKKNGQRKLIAVKPSHNIFYEVPQYIDANAENKDVILYFRVKSTESNKKLVVKCGEKVIYSKKYMHLRPPEMERIKISLENNLIENCSEVSLLLEDDCT